MLRKTAVFLLCAFFTLFSGLQGSLNAQEMPAQRIQAQHTQAQHIQALIELRDAVYDNTPIEAVETLAATLDSRLATGLSEAAQWQVPQQEKNLILSRKEYLRARAWNEAGDKKKAIAGFESAIAFARASMVPEEHADGIYALTKALSELCRLKDLAFLMANGPKISPNAKKVLAMQPGHIGAMVILASAKAYPPGIFGGNPREAIAMLEPMLMSHAAKGVLGAEKDDLFDIQTCLGTAYAKLGDSKAARMHFASALELYPRNIYAREQLENLGP
jgi:tetratricopeptide (TPR) repeat protein